MSCEPGGQEGAKANQGDSATLLTCSRSSCKTGLCVVRVLITTAGGNLGCGTATFLTLSNQQSFALEKRGVKLTECVVFVMAQWSRVIYALRNPEDHLKQPGWLSKKFSSLWPNHGPYIRASSPEKERLEIC